MPDTNKDNRPKTNIYVAFEKTIELDELSFDRKKDDRKKESQESGPSMLYPLIKIGDYIVASFEIDTVTIDSTKFIPSITLQCTFKHDNFMALNTPKDGDIISIAIRNKNDTLKILRNDYVITGMVGADNNTIGAKNRSMTFFGILFIPGLSSSKNNFSFEGTSYNAMKSLAKKGGLGFATNESDTNDKQIWMSGMSSAYEYISNTISRAWSDSTSFYDIWIDIYYNLNFINVDKQLMKEEEELDLGVLIDNIDKDFTYGEDSKQEDAIELPKAFSNFEQLKNTSYFIKTWSPDNNATNITFDVGAKINCNVFEHNSIVYKNDLEKYWKVPIEPTYDPDKINSHILLRGRAKQDPDKKGNDSTKANYVYPDIYVKNPWMGTQYTISDSEKPTSEWNGNQHKNYARAKIQNLINKKELDKLNVIISVTGMNLNMIKGDKIPVILISSNSLENLLINDENDGGSMVDRFYSGWYYIKGFVIKYDHKNDESISSNFSQKYILSRREWPTPENVEPIKKNDV